MWSPQSLGVQHPSPISSTAGEGREPQRRTTGSSRRLFDVASLQPDDKVQVFAQWHADEQLKAIQALDSAHKQSLLQAALSQGDKEEMCSKYIDDPTRPIDMVVFYANPRSPFGSLAIEREVRNVMSTYHILRYRIVPVTTFLEFKATLSAYKPRVFCFTGHADESTVSFVRSFEDNRAEQIDNGTFADAIKQSYGVGKQPEIMLLFACNTKNVIGLLKEMIPRSGLIGWSTITTDDASRDFGNGVFEYLSRAFADSDGRLADMTPEAFRAGADNMSAKLHRIGDPQEKLDAWAEHLACFDREVSNYLTMPYASKSLRACRIDGNPIIEFRCVINGCKHCTPGVHGIPWYWCPGMAIIEEAVQTAAAPSR